MKNIGAIEASKQRVWAWSSFLLDTFRELGMTDNEVIRNCHIGRSTFYRMKHGKQINVDAYLRLSNYAWVKIQEREAKRGLPFGYENKWMNEVIGLVFSNKRVVCHKGYVINIQTSFIKNTNDGFR